MVFPNSSSDPYNTLNINRVGYGFARKMRKGDEDEDLGRYTSTSESHNPGTLEYPIAIMAGLSRLNETTPGPPLLTVEQMNGTPFVLSGFATGKIIPFQFKKILITAAPLRGMDLAGYDVTIFYRS